MGGFGVSVGVGGAGVAAGGRGVLVVPSVIRVAVAGTGVAVGSTSPQPATRSKTTTAAIDRRWYIGMLPLCFLCRASSTEPLSSDGPCTFGSSSSPTTPFALDPGNPSWRPSVHSGEQAVLCGGLRGTAELLQTNCPLSSFQEIRGSAVQRWWDLLCTMGG